MNLLVDIQKASEKYYSEYQPHLRHGQYLMNWLCDNYKEVYEKIPFELDPFYDDLKIPKFLDYLKTISE